LGSGDGAQSHNATEIPAWYHGIQPGIEAPECINGETILLQRPIHQRVIKMNSDSSRLRAQEHKLALTGLGLREIGLGACIRVACIRVACIREWTPSKSHWGHLLQLWERRHKSWLGLGLLNNIYGLDRGGAGGAG
jgi:hypothetical protein